MSVLQKFLLLVAFALPCHSFSDHPPITVCQFLEPHHDHAKTQPLTMSPYRIAVSNSSYTPGQVLQVNITAAQPFKGFMIQARADRNLNPVGQFMGDLDYGATFIWCSGGLPKNSIGHSKKTVFNNMSFAWRAPEDSVGHVRFWATIVSNFSTFWVGLNSSVILTNHSVVTRPPVVLDPDFTITKNGCGTSKSCYSEPVTCKGSGDCQFLVTFKSNGTHLLFEMSTNLGYASVGFHAKQEMIHESKADQSKILPSVRHLANSIPNDTEAVSCSRLANNMVEVRHYWMDYHQPIRTDIKQSSDVVLNMGVYKDGFVKCRFTRKTKPTSPLMRDLSLKKWYYIFAWSHVFEETGGIYYHRKNVSYSAAHVDITKPTVLKNGLLTGTAPTPAPNTEITKDDCEKGKGCWSEPSSCTSSGNCRYLLKYKPTNDSVEFEITGKADWVSIGFNEKSKMDGSEAIICVKETSGAMLKIDHYTMVGYDPPKKSTPRPAALNLIYGIYENNVIKCRFLRKLEASGMRNLNEKVHLIFARGPVTGDGQLEKHSMKTFTTKPVKITQVRVLEASSDILLQAHGILMSIAWLGFASIGMFMARYMRHIWETNVCGKKIWFQVHRSLMFLTVAATIAGFVLVFIHVGGWSEGGGAHSYIGVAVTALAIIQPIMAFFRPHPGTPKRNVFNWAHRTVGGMALLLAIVNTVLGVFLDTMSIVRVGWFALLAYGAALLLVLMFEIFVIVMRNSRSYPVAKTDLKKEEVTIMPSPQPKMTPGEKELHRWMLGILFLLSTATIAALTVLIVIKPGQDDDRK